MNTHLLFDKLAYVDRLKTAGVEDKLARAHAEGLEQAFREEVATTSDLKAEIATLKSDLLTLMLYQTAALIGILGGLGAIFKFV